MGVSIQSRRRLHGDDVPPDLALTMKAFHTSEIDWPKHEEIMHHPSAAKLHSHLTDSFVSMHCIASLRKDVHSRRARKMNRGAKPAVASDTMAWL